MLSFLPWQAQSLLLSSLLFRLSSIAVAAEVLAQLKLSGMKLSIDGRPARAARSLTPTQASKRKGRDVAWSYASLLSIQVTLTNPIKIPPGSTPSWRKSQRRLNELTLQLQHVHELTTPRSLCDVCHSVLLFHCMHVLMRLSRSLISTERRNYSCPSASS